MKEPNKDIERLSALLEGRVSGREREELLAHLAASDDGFEAYTDAVEILMAVEEEEARAAEPAAAEAAVVVPLRDARRGWRSQNRLAMAAAAAGVVLASALVLRDRASSAREPLQLAARANAEGQGLPPGWLESRPWSPLRGDDTNGDRRARAAEAGALLVDLAVAVQARDAGQTRVLANQVLNRFDKAAGRHTPLREIRARAGGEPKSLAPLVESATERVANRYRDEREWLELGAWFRAASLAARRENEKFFRGGTSKAMLSRAERLTPDQPAAQEALVRIRAIDPTEGTTRWVPLEKALGDFLGAIASQDDEGSP